MGITTDMQRRLADLVARGMLVIGKDARPEGPAPITSEPDHHLFYAHDPVWNFIPPRCARPLGPRQEPPLYEALPAGTSLPQALRHTRLCLFLGAALTPELRLALARSDMPLFVFEPRARHLRALLAEVGDDALRRGQTFLFCGDPARFDRPLDQYLGRHLFELGYPVFFVHERVAAQHAAWLTGLVEYVETLFFRRRLYALEGQSLSRSLPLRPMEQGLDYDQTRHLYDNTPLFLTSGRIDDVRGALAGATAVCVAAGPALDAQIPWIKQAMDRGALVIAVNNALRPLLARQVTPHFVVINDTSLGAGKAFTGVPPQNRTILVAHPLAEAGRAVFARRLFFDNYLPKLFGRRQGLRLHGSVISTAFSLARHLGCARVILAGTQLAMPQRFGYAYATGSIHHGRGDVRVAPARTDIWPAQYPVRAASGRLMFTTPNFLDARTWLLDEIRLAGLPVTNLTEDSILYGPGVTVDPAPDLAPEADKWAQVTDLPLPVPDLNRQAVAAWLGGEIGLWETMGQAAKKWLQATILPDTGRLELAEKLIGRCDANGVSYTGQRYGDFDNQAFHAAFFDATDPAVRLEGAWRYCTNLAAMSQELGDSIRQASRLIQRLPERPGRA